MNLPVLNQRLTLVASGRSYTVICADIFYGGFAGHYFDALLPKTSRKRFAEGDQCSIPEVSDTCVADFVSCSATDSRKVRFLIPNQRC
jgi:hypothetical protein